MEKVSRRTLMMALLAGGGALVGSSRRASAFTADAPSARILAMHENACGATASHKELVAEVDSILGDKYTAAEKRQIVAGLTCPICGCPLAGLF